MQVPVWEPPIAGSEIEHVVGMLERLCQGPLVSDRRRS